ncbi:hypothetical protein BJV78DRAFT_1162466 [Lactifluus subvellereus]|nr:hypothetical protein BJV78DRAFT_1162466 [Lactifluus subvellereus]
MDKGKVSAKVNFNNVLVVQSRPSSRPSSPFKAKHPQSPSSAISEPAFRPKAKVSSSAAIIVGRSSSTGNSTAKSTVTPRPPSPFKQSPSHRRTLSSTRSAIDASLVPHGLPRQRSLTSTAEASATRARSGSGSFQPTSSALPSHLSPDSPPTCPAIRVKAKVSTVAKSNGFNTSPTPASSLHPSSPSYATTRPIETPSRTPSIVDLNGFISSPPSPTISTVPIAVHPITTPTSAANPHRYAPRVAPSQASARFQSLSPPGSRDLDNDVHFRVTPKVDPAAIPLLPQSPPTSTVSFSSQSSQNTQSSGISGSTAPTPNSHIHSTTLTTGERGSPAFSPGPGSDVFDDLCDPSLSRHALRNPAAYADQLGDSDRKIRAEAKSNRKIEDLEITNRSLLAINSTLEATKRKQANEIRELRRKLRESRLMLPPREFRAIKSSLGPEDVADDEDVDDGDNEEDGDERDETYNRIKGILNNLLETARRALRVEPGDFEKQGSGVKVLSAEEARSWRGDMGDDLSSIHSAHTDAESDEENGLRLPPPAPSQVTIPGDAGISPEDEDEEKIVTGADEQNTLPPITVTFS